MTPRERRIFHRGQERSYVRSARYALATGNYADAARWAALCMQQETAADIAEAEEHRMKIAKIQKVQRATPPKGRVR